MSIRVRFAPSPTGHIHVGNVRTALFNYLFTKNTGGKFILRIEDTDLERSTLASEELIYEDLKWLGLHADESPLIGGEYAPYRQTERFDIYNKYAQELINKGKAYYCFCSKEELDADRERAAKEGKAFLYNGKCACISKEVALQRIKNGEKPSIRFRADIPNVIVNDLIHGEVSFQTNAFGDFIIIRPDGAPIYNYVVVIDDALMKISHVIRGDDHLPNTPKQVLIYLALGFKPPLFAHIPMILGPDHAKLSKRHGNTSVEQFRTSGYLPEALINYMALLSWSSPDGDEKLVMDELIKKFSLSRVSKSAAVFDFDKLAWLNGQYIREKQISDLFNLCKPYLKDTVIDMSNPKLEQMLLSIRDNLITLADAPKHLEIYFQMPENVTDDAKEILALPTTLSVLNAFMDRVAGKDYLQLDEYKSIMKEIQGTTGAKGKALFMAVRVGLTASTKGPEMDSLATLLTSVEMIKRIKSIICSL